MMAVELMTYRAGLFSILVSLAVIGASGGCASTRPGDLQKVQVVSEKPRVGNVYLLRGWIGIFSTGIDDLGERLNDKGVRAVVYQESQWRQIAKTIADRYDADAAEPIVLIGHSYGADGVVAIARELNRRDVPVDLVVTLDPVTPRTVSSNVRRAVNLYQSNGAWDKLPWLRGIPLEKEESAEQTELVNADLRTDRTDLLEPGLDHFNIEKKQLVQDEVIRQVMEVCVPRPQWQSARRALPIPTLAAQAPTTRPALQASAPHVIPPIERMSRQLTGVAINSAHTDRRADNQ